MITKMTKYTLVSLNENTGALITALQQMGVMDIRRSHKCVDETSLEMMRKAESIKEVMSGTALKAA